MALKMPPRAPALPIFLQQLSTDEYAPLPYSPLDRRIVARVVGDGPGQASRLGISLGDYWASRRGTAAALRALDAEWGGGFYNVLDEALMDCAAADEALGGDQLVIDVQTHYTSDRPGALRRMEFLIGFGASVAPDRFKGLIKLARDQQQAGYSLVQYLSSIYLESETAVAVLSSAPGAEGKDSMRMLTNSEMVGTRELIDRLAGTGRLINHCVVHPNVAGEIDLMDRWRDWCRPAGWKVYTQYGAGGTGPMHWEAPTWFLDDEDSGIPFLERVRAIGVPIVCAHKGLSGGSDPGWAGPASPRDIGAVAAAYPDTTFVVYHSGYEPREGDREEGPYSEEAADSGTNRLIKSLKDAGIGPGGNVYAELGTTWYLVMGHPREASHVLGKLLLAFGEENILWGTDCVFYGSPQPLIDAFRAFHIPQEYTERYGYPQLTPTAKEKILGLNAARLYGMDPVKIRESTRNDDLAWVRAALEEYSAKGTPAIT